MDKCPRLPTQDYQEALGTGERPNVLPISHSLYSKRLSFRCRGMEYTAEIWAPLVAILRYVAALLGFFFQPGNHGRYVCKTCSCMHVCANSYFPRYLGVYLCLSRLYLYVDNGNKAAARNDMLSFLRSDKVSSSGPMKCPLLYNG